MALITDEAKKELDLAIGDWYTSPPEIASVIMKIVEEALEQIYGQHNEYQTKLGLIESLNDVW